MSKPEINNTLDHLFRQEYTKMVSLFTNRYSSDLIDQIEDAVQESLLKAAKLWSFQPMPENPSAWLYRVANNQLIDQLRRQNKSVAYEAQQSADENTSDFQLEEGELVDGQLRMIFACCHPSMKIQEQLMLSLKLLCGLSVKEIARALLKKEDASKKAITRAKQKFKTEVGELSVPEGEAINERLGAVLQVIYLLFNEGYKATEGDELIRHELCEEAIRLAFILTNAKDCHTSELNALIAMMLFKAARFPARTGENGALITLEHQDRSLYREDYIQWGWKFMHESSKTENTSVYQLEAAIASYYTVAASYEKTNWKVIFKLYDGLIKLKPSPVVKMSRVFVMSKVLGAKKALEAMAEIEGESSEVQSFQALKAELYAEAGDFDNARIHLKKAIGQAQNIAEKRFLEAKLLNWKTAKSA
ncbi:RNA polymerase sigma factor [Roseivirga sp.]|uniref:RNA polymerase sigma factor n=1 Tax=Roseivirga sp. TaxID=1964215 RepID=UPI002B272DF4|nr:sigma-70 family RNA polymerase sigma factor [Roseivirga sp.]